MGGHAPPLFLEKHLINMLDQADGFVSLSLFCQFQQTA